jgi:hypothetical protein
MDVFIVGEDDACKAVIRRVIAFCAETKKISITILPQEFPVRGGEIKSKIKNFNLLSASAPVVLLADMDNNTCPPIFVTSLLKGEARNDNFILSIAVDEVEAWLLADRHGFANYFGVDVALIPSTSQIKMQGRVEKKEIVCPVKTSLYCVTEIWPKSRNKTLKEQLIPRPGATKGAEYNSVMVPFIRDHWNVEKAIENSDSLKGMVNRICRYIDGNS